MVSHDSLRNPLLAVLFIIPAVSLWAAEPTTGYQAEVKVTSATRLDWQFACS